MKDLQSLASLPLRSVTIHGNPIDTIPNFRLYIAALIPSLKKIDSVLVSNKERDNANVWINYFMHQTPPMPKKISKPPEEKEQNANEHPKN